MDNMYTFEPTFFDVIDAHVILKNVTTVSYLNVGPYA